MQTSKNRTSTASTWNLHTAAEVAIADQEAIVDLGVAGRAAAAAAAAAVGEEDREGREDKYILK